MKFAAFSLMVVLLLPSVSAQYTQGISDKAAAAGNGITLAEKDMDALLSGGLSATRYNDTLLLAKQVYQAQLALETAGGKPDYSFVEEKLAELKDMKQKALQAMDELKALENAIGKVEGVNKSAVLEIYGQAKYEFDAERYEQALVLINNGYEKISELEALQTKIAAFYESTTRSIWSLLQEWWEEIAVSLALFSAATALSYNRIMCRRLQKRIENLEKRKDSIRKLIMQTQKGYFEKGDTGEETYHIRTKKYAELVRDINRQIPLLKEELAIRRKRKI